MARILVMGVAGAGKSTLGRALADALGTAFVEADDYHTDDARRRMAAGLGLDEAMRQPWLDRVDAACAALPGGAVLACSALRAAHRARLAPDVTLLLRISRAEAERRLGARAGHFAGPALAASQFAALEEPDDAIVIEAGMAPGKQLAQALAALEALGIRKG